MADLHPGVAVLAPLLGVWAGQGAGEYPTIASFDYFEEVTFGHVGKPFLSYVQRTKAADDGRPMHAETGYLRVPSAGRVELVLAHPTGITEIDEGTLTVAGRTIEMDLVATTIGRTASAKDVTALGRSIRVDGDELTLHGAHGRGRPAAAAPPRPRPCTGSRHDHRTERQNPRPGRPRRGHGRSAPKTTPTSTPAAVERIWQAARHWYRGGHASRRSSCACGTTARSC